MQIASDICPANAILYIYQPITHTYLSLITLSVHITIVYSLYSLLSIMPPGLAQGHLRESLYHISDTRQVADYD